ncbi:MAG: long-chain fatty acid--CoA ligase [Trueperaceae bacterium]
MTDVVRQETPTPVAGAVSPAGRFSSSSEGGEVHLGRTLISLLDEAAERNPNPAAFNQLRDGSWRSMSTLEFRLRAELMALGLARQGFERGERVAFFALSDASFALPDMACLIAGLVTVPIYLTHNPANVGHILRESEARALVVTNDELLAEIAPQLADSRIDTVIVMERDAGTTASVGVRRLSAEDLVRGGQDVIEEKPGAASELKRAVAADDLATIIYTSGTTGVPKGVMLSHENISSNAIAAFSGLEGYRRGADEVVLSFLPLTHIFARMLQYGCMWYGNTIYYSDSERLREHFREVRPTLLATVPRVLEKAYDRIMDAGLELGGVKRRLFDWSLGLARRYRVERPPQGAEAVQHRIADRLVLSKWRAALGGRIRFVIVGAAALRPELVNLFGAAGIHVLQGYGLTETSPVISFNRPAKNRPGTVGTPIDGVAVALAEDGEILVRGPNVMMGYYRREDATGRTLQDGWLHTGDVGDIDHDGFIRLTGRIKNLFKLSTGKYVMPQPIEQRLEADPLVEHAVVVGEGEKYCAALLFLSEDALLTLARREGMTGDPSKMLSEPVVQERIRSAVGHANGEFPAWSCVKRAALVVGEVSIANSLLTPTLKLRREPALEKHRAALEALYRPGADDSQAVTIIEVERS